MTEGMKLARLYIARKSLIKEKVRHQVALFFISLHKISCAQQFESKLSLHSLALSLLA